MQKPQSGGEFSVQIPGGARGGMVMAKIDNCITNTVLPRLAPPIRLQILISAPVRVSAPPSDKCHFQISVDFDQKDGEPELFLNQLTSKSLGLFFFIEYSVKYLYAVQKMISS